MVRQSIAKLLFPLVLTLLSCNTLLNLSSTAVPTQIESSPTIEVVEITPTIEPQTSQPCPIPSQMEQSLATGVHSAMPWNILAFLNSGATSDQLEATLQNESMLPEGNYPIQEKDFTGDGLYDLAFSLIDPAARSFKPEGSLLLFVCIDDNYELASIIPSSMDLTVPIIETSDDLNGDGISDIFFSQQTCGAHTCFSHYEILIWDNNAFSNVLQGTTDDIPNPLLEIMFPPHPRIGVIATGYGSVGAGPFRPFKREWTWDSPQHAFIPSSDILLPSSYRIHALYDADRLSKEGEFAAALALYQEVIETDSLQDWVDPGLERANLAAYASFRIMLTHLLLEDRSAAENTFASLQNDFPLGAQGAAFTALAEAFWNEYAPNGDIVAGCSAAQSYAQSHSETVIDSLYFGYANPIYEAEDICPLPPY